MPFGWAAGAAAVGSIASGVISGNAAQDAAQTQADAANNATNAQLAMFNQTQQNLNPYINSGQNALKILNAQAGTAGVALDPNAPLVKPFTMADFHASPGYQFQLQQGLDAVANSGAAHGMTGNTLKALTNYGQGVANQDYWNSYNAYTQNQNNIFNRLYTLAGSGQNAAANLGSLGTTVGNEIGSNMIGAGNALAAGTVGAANALGSGINGAAQNFMLYGMMQQNQPTNPLAYGADW